MRFAIASRISLLVQPPEVCRLRASIRIVPEAAYADLERKLQRIMPVLDHMVHSEADPMQRQLDSSPSPARSTSMDELSVGDQ
jgi:hypothetical protein